MVTKGEFLNLTLAWLTLGSFIWGGGDGINSIQSWVF